MTLRELRVAQGDSEALAIAKRVAREAIRGKISAANEAANRAVGTPRQMLELASQREVDIRVTYTKKTPTEGISRTYEDYEGTLSH